MPKIKILVAHGAVTPLRATERRIELELLE